MKVIIILLGLLLSACSSRWQPVGKIAADYPEADIACQIDSLALFPQRNEYAQKTVYEMVTKSCNKSDDYCGELGLHTVQEPRISTYIADKNADSRDREYIQCMKRKGWYPKKYAFWE